MFTNSEFAEKNPKIVYDFYKASIDGWKWAFENIEKSVDIVFEKYNPLNKSKEALLFEANEIKKIIFDKMEILEQFLMKNEPNNKYI